MKNLFLIAAFSFGVTGIAQNTSYWQQHVDYKMDVKMDVKTYQYKGKQESVDLHNYRIAESKQPSIREIENIMIENI